VQQRVAIVTGRLDLAWTVIERSLAKNPRHAHAAHFRTHVMYERGEVAEAIEYLEGWMPGLDKRSLVHCHLSWHVAPRCARGGPAPTWLGGLSRGCAPRKGLGSAAHNVVTDAASFLWRAELAGQPRSTQLWHEVLSSTATEPSGQGATGDH
jgi:hypothetical protein